MTGNRKNNSKKELLFYQSWGDLVALLMVFFVMLFSMSTLDAVKFRELSSSITSIFNLQHKEQMIEKYKKEEKILEQLMHSLQEYIIQEQLEDMVSVKIEDHKLVMDLGSNLLFNLGSTNLTPKAGSVIQAFTQYLVQVKNANIIVEGHTDDIPIRKKEFPSNWELSAARAASVVRFLAKHGIKEENCYIIGYSQYKPLVPNDSKENRAKNRRIRIIFKPIVDSNEEIDFSSIINMDDSTEILDVTKNIVDVEEIVE